MSRPSTRRMPRMEALEARRLLSTTADVSGEQQLMLELINEARVDPPAAAERVEGNLTQGAVTAIAKDGDTVPAVLAEIAEAQPRPPVAWDPGLAEAAERQTDYIIDLGYQTHDGPAGLRTAADRAEVAGYVDAAAVAENVILGVSSAEHAMQAFLADYGPTNAHDPHRENIQQTAPAEDDHQDVGVAILPVAVPAAPASPFAAPGQSATETKLVVTQVFASKQAPEAPKLLGVVYDDGDGDRFYDVGEGVPAADVTITDKATGAATEVQTWSSGGYQAEVRPGAYQIEVRLGDRLIGRRDAVVGTDNTKVDFRVGEAPRASHQVATPPATPTPPPSPKPPAPAPSPVSPAPSPVSPAPAPAPSPAAPQPAPLPQSIPPAAPAARPPAPSPATAPRPQAPAPALGQTPASPAPTTPSASGSTPTAPASRPSFSTGAPSPAETSKAIGRLRTIASRAVSAEPTGGSATISLLRSSLSGNLRSWKIAD